MPGKYNGTFPPRVDLSQASREGATRELREPSRGTRSMAAATKFLILFLLQQAAAWLCEDVESYYASVGNLQGKELEMELNRIIRQEYSMQTYAKAWSAISSLDETQPGSGMVRLLYSDDVAPAQTGCPNNKCVWTREHVWPQVGLTSHFKGIFVHTTLSLCFTQSCQCKMNNQQRFSTKGNSRAWQEKPEHGILDDGSHRIQEHGKQLVMCIE